MTILPMTALLLALHASATQDCTIDGMAANIVSSASPKELAVLGQDRAFGVRVERGFFDEWVKP